MPKVKRRRSASLASALLGMDAAIIDEVDWKPDDKNSDELNRRCRLAISPAVG